MLLVVLKRSTTYYSTFFSINLLSIMLSAMFITILLYSIHKSPSPLNTMAAEPYSRSYCHSYVLPSLNVDWRSLLLKQVYFYGFLYCKMSVFTAIKAFFFNGSTALSRLEPHFRGFRTAIDTSHSTLHRSPLDEWQASGIDLHLTTHSAHKRRTLMPSERFEQAVPTKRGAADLRLSNNGRPKSL